MTDSLFIWPAVNGLCLAILLGLWGCYLRLRSEWLSAIAFPHVAAAGALAALAVGAPLVPGGIGAALLAAVVKRQGEKHGSQNAVFVLLLLAGWSLAVLLAANLPMAERLGHALFDGQLYFTDGEQAIVLVVALITALGMLRALSRTLMLAQLFPQLVPAGTRRPKHGLMFDLGSAAVLSLATLTLGVMGTFALVFVPAWLASLIADDWRRSLRMAGIFAVVAYGLAFFGALEFDQPFGPCLAATTVLLALVRLAIRRDCISPRKMLKD